MTYNLNMPKQKTLSKSQGFTLIELLIVVLIIGVLSGVVLAVLNSSGIQQKARDSQRKSDLKVIQAALELYYADNRTYLQTPSQWRIAGTLPTVYPAFAPYISKVPKDPKPAGTYNDPCSAGNAGYLYRSNGTSPYNKYVLTARMELSDSATDSVCSSVPNCSSSTVVGCNCGAPCYGVQNPN
ncbi:MAG: hypothetical protein UU77_C0010G0026 [candidate division WWE3 bacterium GW2011_GWC1_41_7]|uniref:General secretion pathway protein G n=4 Tax=Katanobacteria TaxID=422282 RepID=A0A0G0XA00_UNCKA|nr:MAG: hypothetical protein UU72_C0010G0027 [candidate division WWE3 bacterium GW2011_GWB1_41_6]KKS21002.1 MAG: hypothetical protein UU77_C0010G0026 [candidate division WWE3 bacterium GW2011_GWC1_41_7]KKS21755.1 MAG: hypothetical protein UU80_C0021G0026 [candidate division WWE3 bacterium GW2011_GWA1_41_8]